MNPNPLDVPRVFGDLSPLCGSSKSSIGRNFYLDFHVFFLDLSSLALLANRAYLPLQHTGYPMTIYNRSDSERVQNLAAKGATLAASPAAVGAASDIVFTMVRFNVFRLKKCSRFYLILFTRCRFKDVALHSGCVQAPTPPTPPILSLFG